MIMAVLAAAFGFLGLGICSRGGQRFGAIGFLGIAVGLIVALQPSVSLTSGWGGLIFASASLLLRGPSRRDWPSGLWLSVCIAICTVLLGFATEAALVRLGWALWWLQPVPIVGWALVGTILARVASRSIFPFEYLGLYATTMLAFQIEGTPSNQEDLWVGLLSVSVALIFSYMFDHKREYL